MYISTKRCYNISRGRSIKMIPPDKALVIAEIVIKAIWDIISKF